MKHHILLGDLGFHIRCPVPLRIIDDLAFRSIESVSSKA